MASKAARNTRQSTAILAAATILLSTMVVAVRSIEGAKATSGGDPYSVPAVIDTNPDPAIVETTIVADETDVDIGNGVVAHGMTFNGAIPGPEFRLKVGDTVIVHFENHLATEATGIHWHGVELDNASDGTPLTQNQTAPGGSFLYKFKVTRPGIFWYHPHHHSSTNQLFKGLYGSIIVTDPNAAALVTSGTLPNASRTKTVVLSDMTVCKTAGGNDGATYVNTGDNWLDGQALPPQLPPVPSTLCDTPINDHGFPLGGPLGMGDVPNIQLAGAGGRTNEGQTVLTNGKNVGGRPGSPSAPQALPGTSATLDVQPGQGLRLQIINASTIRYMRLRLTTNTGVQIPLVRVGGEGGLLDNAVVEGNTPTVGVFDFKYLPGESLLGPGDRADLVAAIPATATGVATLWTMDFSRTGATFTDTPTVPVMHLNVTGAAGSYSIAAGTPLRAATLNPVEVLGAPDGVLLNPASFLPTKPGLLTPDIRLTSSPGATPPSSSSLGINDLQGTHDFPGDYTVAPHAASARYAELGDTLELTITNVTLANHPFHLHGFSIQPKDLTKAGGPNFTFTYNEFMDEIDVPPGYILRFRVRLDDRKLMDGVTDGGGLGRWVMHCHIFFHAVNGMISELDVVSPTGNEAPHVNSTTPKAQANQGQTATMTGTYSDPDGDAVTLTGPAVGALVDNLNGTWSWSLPNSVGPDKLLYVTATDAGGRTNQVAFQLVVVPVPSLPAVVRTSTTWLLHGALATPGSTFTQTFGTRPLTPIMGDWDGNGSKTPGTYQAGTFRLTGSNAVAVPPVVDTFSFGSDVKGFAVAGDFDGDGKDDVGAFRNGVWQIRLAVGGPLPPVTFGSGIWPGTVPVTGDWDGDGKDGIGTYSAGTWKLHNDVTDLDGSIDIPAFLYNPGPAPYPVVGDWNGDGVDTVGVRSTNGVVGTWRLRNLNGAGVESITFDFGLPDDLPVAWH
jgi:FtsP/CotA-like multicopper oxidase with cupredoxin domain